MIVYRAAWVCPIDQPPIAKGWVAVDDGRIVQVSGPAEQPRSLGPMTIRDLGSIVLMPGLVNAHTHLELSWLRGRVPPSASFIGWITQLFAQRRRPEDPEDPAVLSAAFDAAVEARESGTVAVGDISNSLASATPMARAGLHGLIFHELLGFADRDGSAVDRSMAVRQQVTAQGARVTIAPHAPYSTSPELFRAIRAAVTASDLPITSVHLGESPDEVEMLAHGTGAWPGMLKFVGVWREDWAVPHCGPVEYLDGLGVLDAKTLVVHGVQFDDRALDRLAVLGSTLVTCPRSNEWVGVGVPPVERFYRSGVAVAVGTDSLASVSDLNLFSELKTMRWLAPSVPARELLKSATIVGARALGLDTELGTLAPGKLATMIAVELPDHTGDVEEYLVNGIDARQIQWVQ
jgi:cytosine/adenosine deaminase-related metal-dependent hydrolase